MKEQELSMFFFKTTCDIMYVLTKTTKQTQICCCRLSIGNPSPILTHENNDAHAALTAAQRKATEHPRANTSVNRRGPRGDLLPEECSGDMGSPPDLLLLLATGS
jgi:hypothetical protein